jgi:hypothetical protein
MDKLFDIQSASAVGFLLGERLLVLSEVEVRQRLTSTSLSASRSTNKG